MHVCLDHGQTGLIFFLDFQKRVKFKFEPGQALLQTDNLAVLVSFLFLFVLATSQDRKLFFNFLHVKLIGFDKVTSMVLKDWSKSFIVVFQHINDFVVYGVVLICLILDFINEAFIILFTLANSLAKLHEKTLEF